MAINRRAFIAGCVAAGAGAALPGMKPKEPLIWIDESWETPIAGVAYKIPAGFGSVIFTNRLGTFHFPPKDHEQVLVLGKGSIVRKA